MENIKYILLFLFIGLFSIGWFGFENNCNYKLYKETLLTNKEKTKHIKNPDFNTWYFRKESYQIIRKKSLIPFKYESIDTIKKPIKIEYFSTTNPSIHNNSIDDAICDC